MCVGRIVVWDRQLGLVFPWWSLSTGWCLERSGSIGLVRWYGRMRWVSEACLVVVGTGLEISWASCPGVSSSRGVDRCVGNVGLIGKCKSVLELRKHRLNLFSGLGESGMLSFLWLLSGARRVMLLLLPLRCLWAATSNKSVWHRFWLLDLRAMFPVRWVSCMGRFDKGVPPRRSLWTVWVPSPWLLTWWCSWWAVVGNRMG